MTAIEHFSKLTAEILRDLQQRGIISLYKDESGTVPMEPDSPEAQALIEHITTSIYEGAVKDMNQHRAPDLS